jgi:hypothetical protein
MEVFALSTMHYNFQMYVAHYTLIVAYKVLVGKADGYHKEDLGTNGNTVKPALNGISRVQNIFPLRPRFRSIKVHYDSHGT